MKRHHHIRLVRGRARAAVAGEMRMTGARMRAMVERMVHEKNG